MQTRNVVNVSQINRPMHESSSANSSTLTKAQLAELLFDQLNVSKREAKEMVDAFFDLIAQSLINGEEVKLAGLGNFQVRAKAPRPGRNPRTGELIPIEARRVVTFHASAKLKTQIQMGTNRD